MPEPLAYSVNDFLRIACIGRTHFYKAVAAGDITVRKNGTKTVILAADAKRYLDNLPTVAPRAA